MNKELLKALKYQEEYKFENDSADFSNNDYTPIPFSIENFHQPKIVNADKKIAFIDGGNTEIIKESHRSLQLIRIYYTIYQKNKRIFSKTNEYYILVRIKKGKFVVDFFDSNETTPNNVDLELDSSDITIKEGLARGSVSKIGNISRLFSEFITATTLSKEVDYIVMDGTLQRQVTNHEKYIDKLINEAKKNNCQICGLSKSSNIVTKKGYSLIQSLKKNSPEDIWYYYPLFKSSNEVNIYAARFHKKSKKSFRFEIVGNINDEIFSLISKNSKDAVFIGYPYGLIEADRFARVSNQEKDYFKTRLMLNSDDEKDSHEILDNISY